VTAQLPLRAGPPGAPAVPGAPGERAGAAVIETEGLTKTYPGAVTALDSLTVSVAPGITGLVGANGAGKSTLIKILLGLLPPTSGRVSVLGEDVSSGAERIRMLTGYMPEHDCLPPDVTATELVTHLGRMSGLPRTAARERAAESLRHVGLYEERYRQIGTYSTGMKQRVKLAQALVGDPRLLLLDEPTIGLDPAGRGAMLDLISRVGAEFGISIVVSSHLLGEIEQICDHLVAIDAGRLLRSDTIATFTQVSQVLMIEVDEGAEALAAELGRRGLAPQAAGRSLLVRIADDGTYDEVRDAIADLALPLNRLEQQRRRVEELFRDPGPVPGADAGAQDGAPGGQPHGAPAGQPAQRAEGGAR
jgi:ABC-2 type transport system ATP-binding protein